MRKLGLVVGSLTALAGLAWAPGASAGTLVNERVVVPATADRTCFERELAGAGVAKRSATAPGTGAITATLDGGSGDWDLAVFDRRSGRLVGGGAGFGAREVAGGKVTAGQRLVVQACRRDS